MILNDVEKERIVKSLSWMITDMKHRHDQSKENFQEGSQGDYSPELTEAMRLLEEVIKLDTVGITGFHRKLTLLNCREFICISNKQGVCKSPSITLESKCLTIIGQLKCVEAEKPQDKEIL